MSEQTEEAFKFLESATANISTNLEGHSKIQQCFRILRAHIQDMEERVVAYETEHMTPVNGLDAEEVEVGPSSTG